MVSTRSQVVRRSSTTPSGGVTSAMRNVVRAAVNTPAIRNTVQSAVTNAVTNAVRRMSATSGLFSSNSSRRSSTGSMVLDPPAQVRVPMLKKRGLQTGFYKGSFKRPKKLKKDNDKVKALRYGYKKDKEFFGKVEDPNVIYVGHSTKNELFYGDAITGIILRKLFAKAGLPISNESQELQLSSWDNSDGFRIQYIVQDTITGQRFIQMEYNTTDNLNFEQIIENCAAMRAHITAFIRKENSSEPFRIHLYSFIGDGSPAQWKLAASIHLTTEKITFVAKSSMKVQNRTAGTNAGVGDLDADRVDNQPLAGKLYYFSQAAPRLTSMLQNNNTFLQNIEWQGLQLVRGAQLNLNYQNPPTGRLWKNCIASSNILIQPGHQKSNVIMHKFDGRLITVLNRMKNESAVAQRFVGGAGKFAYICLEEKIRTASTNPISIQYETHQEFFGYLTSTKPAPITGQLIVQAVDNLPT